METLPHYFQFRCIIHNSSDSNLLNNLPLPFDPQHYFDIYTHFNVYRRSSDQFFPLSEELSQCRLPRDLIASSDESIRASLIRSALVASMPLEIASALIDNAVQRISSEAYNLANQRLLNMGLVVDVIYYDEREAVEIERVLSESNIIIYYVESGIERVLSESMEDNNLGFKPASRSCIDGLKRVRVEDDRELSPMEDNCTICLEKHSIGDEVIRLPCNHVFHGDCILEWLQTSHLCPLCRFSMSSIDGED